MERAQRFRAGAGRIGGAEPAALGIGGADPDTQAKLDVLRGPGVHLRDIAFGQEALAPTRGLLERYKIRYVYHESTGGHEWVNWRRYLEDFAPRLFQPAK